MKIKHRGPDNTHIADMGNDGWMGFHRLSIMDVSEAGNQPLKLGHLHLVCNGEIYNYPQLRKELATIHSFQSHSDCEVILPLFKEKGIENTAQSLDGEFAFVISGYANILEPAIP